MTNTVSADCVLTHAAKLREVLLGSLVLLILVDPLVKVGLEEVGSLGFLDETGPVLRAEVLLLEPDLDVLGGVADLALGGVDLVVEVELDVVLLLKSAGLAGEDEAGSLEVQLDVVLGHVRDRDGQVDVVLGSIFGGGALGPEDCGHVSDGRQGGDGRDAATGACHECRRQAFGSIVSAICDVPSGVAVAIFGDVCGCGGKKVRGTMVQDNKERSSVSLDVRAR